MNDFQKTAQDVVNLLEYQQSLGIREIPIMKKKCCSRTNHHSSVGVSASDERPTTTASTGRRATSDSTLESLRADIGDCERCKLCKGRTNLVFGVGNPNAKLIFIGEGPGRDEDIQGIPFVGRAGQLLTKIIQAMGYKREDVYIANVVKCRPPENRNPEPDEIAACFPFVMKQVEIIKPKAIICLGKFAAQCVLNTEAPITRLRGQMGEFCGIPVMPTYHPAYLLRNPDAKKVVWEDVQKVMKILAD